MEDIKIGRKAIGRLTIIPVETAKTFLVGASEKRIALCIYPVANNMLVVSTGPDVTATTGIRISDTIGPLELFLDRHGAIVTQSWLAAIPAGADNVAVIETFYDSDKAP